MIDVEKGKGLYFVHFYWKSLLKCLTLINLWINLICNLADVERKQSSFGVKAIFLT